MCNTRTITRRRFEHDSNGLSPTGYTLVTTALPGPLGLDSLGPSHCILGQRAAVLQRVGRVGPVRGWSFPRTAVVVPFYVFSLLVPSILAGGACFYGVEVITYVVLSLYLLPYTALRTRHRRVLSSRLRALRIAMGGGPLLPPVVGLKKGGRVGVDFSSFSRRCRHCVCGMRRYGTS